MSTLSFVIEHPDHLVDGGGGNVVEGVGVEGGGGGARELEAELPPAAARPPHRHQVHLRTNKCCFDMSMEV